MKCPCEECISYAICKLKMDKRNTSRGIKFLLTMKNCEDLENFLRPDRRISVRKINDARLVFDLEPLQKYKI